MDTNNSAVPPEDGRQKYIRHWVTPTGTFSAEEWMTPDEHAAYQAEIEGRHTQGIYTMFEAAQILASTHGMDTKQVLSRMVASFDEGMLTVRDSALKGAPKLAGVKLRTSVDWVFSQDVQTMLDGWGVAYRFPQAAAGTLTRWTPEPHTKKQDAAPTGFYSLRDTAQEIAAQLGWHDGARDTLLKQFVQAARDDLLTVRHPHTLTPYRPETVRDFYELVTPQDVNEWAVRGRVPWRWEVETPEAQAVPVVPKGTATAAPMLKQRAQESRILELLTSKGHHPLELPARTPGQSGAKAEIRKLALLEPALFSKKTFDTAWQRLREDGRVVGGE